MSDLRAMLGCMRCGTSCEEDLCQPCADHVESHTTCRECFLLADLPSEAGLTDDEINGLFTTGSHRAFFERHKHRMVADAAPEKALAWMMKVENWDSKIQYAVSWARQEMQAKVDEANALYELVAEESRVALHALEATQAASTRLAEAIEYDIEHNWASYTMRHMIDALAAYKESNE